MSAIYGAAWTLGESGEMICIKCKPDKILLCLNQRNKLYLFLGTWEAIQ
jgi:hypothetical protein